MKTVAVFIVPTISGTEGFRLACVFHRITGMKRIRRRWQSRDDRRTIFEMDIVPGRSRGEMFELLGRERTRPPRLFIVIFKE